MNRGYSDHIYELPSRLESSAPKYYQYSYLFDFYASKVFHFY